MQTPIFIRHQERKYKYKSTPQYDIVLLYCYIIVNVRLNTCSKCNKRVLRSLHQFMRSYVSLLTLTYCSGEIFDIRQQ